MSLGLGSCTFEVLLGDALEEGCHCQNPPKMSDMPIPPPLHATMKISRIMMCACVAYVERLAHYLWRPYVKKGTYRPEEMGKYRPHHQRVS